MSSIVIKVKYDETLRRFNVAINEDKRLDLSIEGLRLKISSLFNFHSDVDFRLTYKDEDDELVTLADDDDLRDVVRQGLDPVRVTVHLKPDQGAQSSSDSSTPLPQNGLPGTYELLSFSETLKSTQERANLQKDGTPDVAKILKSGQEPLAQALSKLSLDISSKATSTSSILADIFDELPKMGKAYANAPLPKSGATTANPHVEVGNESIANSSVGKHDGIVDVAVKLPPCPSVASDMDKNKSCESISSKMSTSSSVKRNKDVSAGKKGSPKTVPPGFPPSNRSLNDVVDSVIHEGISCDGCEVYPITGPRFKSKVRYNYDLCSLCFSMMGNDTDYTRINPPMAYKHPQLFKAPDAADSLVPLLHNRIECDGCGRFPITGPRFKSKVKNDYDLCHTCFSRMGNDIDYTRIEYPVAYRSPQISKSPGVVVNVSPIVSSLPATAPQTNPPAVAEDLELTMAVNASLQSGVQQGLPDEKVEAASSTSAISTPSPLIHYSTIDFHAMHTSGVMVHPGNNTSEDGSKKVESSSCVICFDAPVQGACVPCGHMVGCMSCLNEIKAKSMGCPVCRTLIDQVIKVYAV